MATITVPQATSSVALEGEFKMVRNQAVLTKLNGESQVTTFADKHWEAVLRVKPRQGANLRLWSQFATDMSDLANVVAYGPPHYSGPSTGYAGANPLVNGASQTGLSLVCDGVSISTAIALKGDFICFDVTTALSNTNRQLIQLSADATSDGAGNVTFSLSTPIRLSPANNATVTIQTPTALFRLAEPEAGVGIDSNDASEFVFNLVERIFP